MATEFAATEEALPTPTEVRDQVLADVYYARTVDGLPANVKKGSELWYRVNAYSNRLSIAFENGKLRLRQMSPYRAQGDDLLELAAFFGVEPRPASKSTGFVTIALEPGTSSVTIPAGFKLSGPTGVQYQTTAATVGADASSVIAVESVQPGDNDAPPDTILTWDSAAVAGLKPSATVTATGIDGGREADDVETVRARLLRKLAFPATGGNWAHIIELAEESSAAVVRAFVYPNERGPGSYGLAIMGDADAPVLNAATQLEVHNYVAANMPGDGTATDALGTTSVALEELDVVIDIDVPLPTTAGGVGGGFTDATPWPSSAETAGVFAEVTAVGSNTITVDSTSADAPTTGARFAVWDSSAKEMVEFSAVDVAGSGPYVITVDSNQTTKLGQVVVGARCSALAEDLGEYAEAFMTAVDALGPGEKTDDVDILRFARRRPPPDVESPYALTSTALSAVSASRSEVFDIAYASRTETGTSTTRTAPSAPATTDDPPNRLTVKHLSFRAKV